MKSKVEKLSDKKIKINAFNRLICIRGIVFLAFLIFFVVFVFCNGAPLNLKMLSLVTLLSYCIYYMYLKDWFIGYTKYIELEEDYVRIGKRKILREDLDCLSLVVSSMTRLGIKNSYRLEILLDKGFFNDMPFISRGMPFISRGIPLISFGGDEGKLGEETGKEIADFLGLEFKGLNYIGN